MLKSLVVFASLAFILDAASGEAPRPGRKARPPFTISAESSPQTRVGVLPQYPSAYLRGPGDSLGFTRYDYGTNGSANHNLINYGDGALSLGRMAGFQVGHPDRGTKFSHSTNNGISWLPLSSVEATRVGWSNIDQIRGPIGGGLEATVAHAGLELNFDVSRGAGTWQSVSTGSTAGATWPKLAIGGDLAVHILCAGPNPPTGIYYTRTTDGGSSFNPVDQAVLAAGTPDADAYDVAAQGTKVVLVSAGSGGDVVMQFSTNYGTTWTTQVIYDVAGPGGLPPGTSQFQPDGSCSVIYDNAGNIRVVWGDYLAIGDPSGNPVLYTSIDAPIMYWSQATGLKQIAFPVHDTTFAGGAVGHDGNFATQPDIGVDASNNLYVVFSQLISELDAATPPNNYEHVYALRSTNGGNIWSTPVDVTPGTGFDAAFPSLADLVDTHLHIVYNSDPLAGNSIQSNHAEGNTAIMYLKVPISALTVDVGEGGTTLPLTYSLKQNYPNPFNPTTVIDYTVAQSGHASIKVYDVLGKEVAVLLNENVQPGSYQASFDGSKLPSGVYVYQLKAGSYSESRKMLLLK